MAVANTPATYVLATIQTVNSFIAQGLVAIVVKYLQSKLNSPTRLESVSVACISFITVQAEVPATDWDNI
jgi:hypothetical protein